VSIDPIFLDGRGDYQPPAPGTVGAVSAAGPVTISLGAGEAAAVLSLLQAQPPAARAQLTGLSWHDDEGARPLADGEVLAPETVITRRQFPAAWPGDIRIYQEVRLVDQAGEAARQGQACWRADRSGVPAADPSTDEIASPGWGEALARRLSADPAFTSSASTFDGSIGFASVCHPQALTVEFRIYRGSIVETSRKSLDGPTYAIEAGAVTWAQLITGRHDDYVRLAAQGQFRIRGSGFQYLRMTKTTRIMIWHARQLRREASVG
jgi:hypothetical protein